MGHPRSYINLDKAQICPCEYCGLPFVRKSHSLVWTAGLEEWMHNTDIEQANEHHRAHLEALSETSYPLKALGDAAEVGEGQRVTSETLGQR